MLKFGFDCGICGFYIDSYVPNACENVTCPNCKSEAYLVCSHLGYHTLGFLKPDDCECGQVVDVFKRGSNRELNSFCNSCYSKHIDFIGR